ncbi:MAG: SDR family NAD(P)-dependent oxidoreductase [Acetobacterales bacterium]
MPATYPAPYKAALITGASSGIGAAFARELPAETDLLLAGRDTARLQAVADGLRRDGRRVETALVDLRDRDACASLADRADAFGIDLLINNAGIGAFAPLTESTQDQLLDMIDVNVAAPVILTRRLLPRMAARAEADGRRAGVIVLSSVVGIFPTPWFSTYSATKGFDLYFAEGLAGEMAGQPVDVLALCPGSTETAFHATAGVPFAPEVGVVPPERVAREGLRALGRKATHVVGLPNKFAALMHRVLPRRATGWILGRGMVFRYRRGDWLRRRPGTAETT